MMSHVLRPEFTSPSQPFVTFRHSGLSSVLRPLQHSIHTILWKGLHNARTASFHTARPVHLYYAWPLTSCPLRVHHLLWHSPVSQTTLPCDCNSPDRHYYPLALDTKNIFALKTNNTRVVCKLPVPLYNHDVIYGRPLNIAGRNWKICCTAADRERDRHTERQIDRQTDQLVHWRDSTSPIFTELPIHTVNQTTRKLAYIDSGL